MKVPTLYNTDPPAQLNTAGQAGQVIQQLGLGGTGCALKGGRLAPFPKAHNLVTV